MNEVPDSVPRRHLIRSPPLACMGRARRVKFQWQCRSRQCVASYGLVFIAVLIASFFSSRRLCTLLHTPEAEFNHIVASLQTCRL